MTPQGKFFLVWHCDQTLAQHPYQYQHQPPILTLIPISHSLTLSTIILIFIPLQKRNAASTYSTLKPMFLTLKLLISQVYDSKADFNHSTINKLTPRWSVPCIITG